MPEELFTGRGAEEMERPAGPLRPPAREGRNSGGRALPGRLRLRPAVHYTAALAVTAAALGMTLAVRGIFSASAFQAPFFLYAIVFSSWFGGFRAGLLADFLSIVCIGAFLLPEDRPAFWVEFPRLSLYFLAGAGISWLGGLQRRHEETLQQTLEKLEETVQARTAALQQAGERLREKEAELTRAARAAVAGELTASIAHEISQPLAAVVTNAGACRRWLALDPPDLGEAREALQRIARDGKRAAEIIQRLRGLFVKGREEAVRVSRNINETVQETVALMQSELTRRGAVLEYEPAEGLPAVEMDQVQIQQILMNLMSNGLDAMEGVDGRTHVLRVRTGLQGPREVFVAVEDSGAGLPPEHRERLFDSFYTTRAHGLGMGLSISRSIAEAHGGSLRAEPNGGGAPGATFAFTLPAAQRGAHS